MSILAGVMQLTISGQALGCRGGRASEQQDSGMMPPYLRPDHPAPGHDGHDLRHRNSGKLSVSDEGFLIVLVDLFRIASTQRHSGQKDTMCRAPEIFQSNDV